MSFVPRLSGVNSDNITKLNADNGDFYVCPSGGLPDAPFIFFYGDDVDQFFFYVRLINNSDRYYEIDVFEASNERRRGGPPKFSPQRIKELEHNIYYLFENRYIANLEEPLNPVSRPGKIVFSWRVSK